MNPPFRLRASHITIDVDERTETGRYDRRYSLLVDWTGHVTVTTGWTNIRLHEDDYLDALQILQNEYGLISFHPVGPEDSEPFLTETVRALFAKELDALQPHNGTSWHDWDPVE